MRGLLAIVFACGTALGLYFFLFAPEGEPTVDTTNTAGASSAVEVRPPIVVGVTPAHGTSVDRPQVISVRATEPLADTSRLTATRVGGTVLDWVRTFTADQMAMEIPLPVEAEAGTYAVAYSACGAATEFCGEGSFAFSVR